MIACAFTAWCTAQLAGAGQSDGHIRHETKSGAAQALVTLRTQYRMAAGIQALANALVYNGALRAGGARVESARLDVQPWGLQHPPWLQQVRGAPP
jgi:hypothetical protein